MHMNSSAPRLTIFLWKPISSLVSSFSHEIQYSMSLRQLANVAFAVVSGDLAAHKFLLDAEIFACEYVPHLKAVAGGGGNADILKIEFNMGVALISPPSMSGALNIHQTANWVL